MALRDEPQLPLRVEDEDVRGRYRPVLPRHRLRLPVVEVGERPPAILGPDLHVLERVAEVGVALLVEAQGEGVVRRDEYDLHAAAREVGVETLDPLLVGLRGRAVVGGEDDHENLRRREALEGVPLAVDAGQVEVRSLRSDGQGGDGRTLGGAGGKGGEREQRERRERGTSGWGHEASADEGRAAARLPRS
jgi:hypothetical protein